jgi:hypothetical protein
MRVEIDFFNAETGKEQTLTVKASDSLGLGGIPIIGAKLQWFKLKYAKKANKLLRVRSDNELLLAGLTQSFPNIQAELIGPVTDGKEERDVTAQASGFTTTRAEMSTE